MNPDRCKGALDCRSEEGITVGLIDSIISICRVLSERLQEEDKRGEFVREALKDLREDEDFQVVSSKPIKNIMGEY